MNFPPFVTKNNLRGIRMGIGPIWGSSSLTPLSSLVCDNEYKTKENKNWIKDKIELQHISNVIINAPLHSWYPRIPHSVLGDQACWMHIPPCLRNNPTEVKIRKINIRFYYSMFCLENKLLKYTVSDTCITIVVS